MNIKDKEKEIQQKIENIVAEEQAELIDFRIFFSSRRYIVRGIVDYPGGGITLKACAAINKKVVSCLDSNNFLGEDYLVQINSPGLDRPLKSSKDFLRAKGKFIFLWLSEPILKKEYLEGIIREIDKDKLWLESEGKTVGIDFDKIKFGKEKISIKDF